MLAVLDNEVGGEGFRDWTPFDHPQLGPVEIGGWESTFTTTNPPGSMLEEVTAPNARFVLRAAQTAPLLEIRDVTVEPLGGDIHRVSLAVHNTGFLPSFITEMGRKSGVAKPVKVTVDLGEGGELVSGDPELELGHLDGRSSIHGQLLWRDVSPMLNRVRAEWIVRQPAGSTVTVTASTPKAGTATVEITLG
jgi:hypothetical protein